MSDTWELPRISDGEIADALFGSTTPTPPPATRPHKPPRPRATRRSTGRRKAGGAVVRITVAVAASVGLTWVINTYVMQSFVIPSQSMASTLDVGDRVFVSHLVPRFLDLHRGDIVVFTDPDGWLTKPGVQLPPAQEPTGVAKTLIDIGFVDPPRDDYLIKRVIGLPGDHVAADGTGAVTVNGQPIDETYLDADVQPSTTQFDVVVPAGCVWVMGDNRSNSADSRFNQDSAHHGAVPLGDIFGVAMVNLSAEAKFERLLNPASTFEAVPDALSAPTPATPPANGG